MNYLQYYSFDKLKGPGGDTINSDLDSAVFIDINVFSYVTKVKILGGNLAFVAGLPFANTSLTLADQPARKRVRRTTSSRAWVIKPAR